MSRVAFMLDERLVTLIDTQILAFALSLSHPAAGTDRFVFFHLLGHGSGVRLIPGVERARRVSMTEHCLAEIASDNPHLTRLKLFGCSDSNSGPGT